MSSIESMNGVGGAGVLQGTRGYDSRRIEFETKFKEAALSAGLDPAAADGLQDEIREAIAAATQQSDSTADRRQVVQNAIDGVLQKHGVDLEKFHSQMKPQMAGPGGSPPGQQPPSESGRADFEAKLTEAAVASGLDPEAADELQEEIKSAIDGVLAFTDGATDPRQTIQDMIDSLLEKYGVDLDEFKSQLQSLMGGPSTDFPLVDERA